MDCCVIHNCGAVAVVDTDSCSGISVESCTRSQNQGIPGQPGAITMIRQ